MWQWLRRLLKLKPKHSAYIMTDDGTETPWFRTTRVGMPLSGGVTVTAARFVNLGESEPEDKRVEITPADLIKFIEAGANVSLVDIDVKIEQLRERKRFWKETLKRVAPLEINHAIIMLEARKKYPELKASIPWRTTTKERIEEICEKYKVEHRGIGEFIPELPEEAVREVMAFTAVYRRALSDKPELQSPVLSVVAPTALFKTRKGDPILLAAAPFGEFYYVLCAWDKEVKFVEELLA